MANTTTETFNKINGAGHDFKNKVQQAEGTLDKISHDAGEKIGSMASKLSDSATDYVKTGRTYVKEHPEKGIALAALVGAVVGSLFTMSLRRK